MPRTRRIVIPEVPYHVTQRGNNRQDVFLVQEDRRRYLQWLGDYSRRFEMDILAWCLMTNHVHMVTVPRRQDSLARAIGLTDQRHAQYMNLLHKRTGHLWQDRFYSCPMDEKHAMAAIRYVEQNPVREGLAAVAWEYPWSSAAAHVGERDRWGLVDLSAWFGQRSAQDWREVLRADLNVRQADAIRRHTARGRPLGADAFVSRMESLLGLRLHALPRGRPKGAKDRRKRNR
jgi:putative transposase